MAWSRRKPRVINVLTVGTSAKAFDGDSLGGDIGRGGALEDVAGYHSEVVREAIDFVVRKVTPVIAVHRSAF